MISRQCLGAVLLTVTAMPFAQAASDKSGLDHWLNSELVPYVRTQLLEHPRFKGETVMFVVLDGNAPASVSNAFTLSLRDRLLNAAVETAGVEIGWAQGQSPARGNSAAIDCTRNDVHYYIGLRVSRALDGGHAVSVRAVDREDKSWVTGFGKTWRGNLNRLQREAMQQTRVDPSFLGARDVPFSLAQMDLMATHLAHELSCSLLQQLDGNYVVSSVTDPATNVNDELEINGALRDAVELIGNNIASNAAIEITSDESHANARLSGKAHQIDGNLYQYWLTITPTDENARLGTLTASAYVLSPNTRLASNSGVPARRQSTISIPNAGQDALLGPLSILAPTGPDACEPDAGDFSQRSTYWSRGRQCSFLNANTNSDAIIFVMEHQPQLGLVRLSDRDCRVRTNARVVRAGQALHVPIAYSQVGNSQTRQIEDWSVTPSSDTYYAIAISDARAARRLANHIDHLPLRCGTKSQPGLTGAPLRNWLDEFATIAARSAGHMDWRAIEVKDIL
jgi:hypothetical protein